MTAGYRRLSHERRRRRVGRACGRRLLFVWFDAPVDLAPCGHQGACRRGAQLVQHPRRALVLGLRLVAPARLRQEPNETSTYFFIERVNPNELARMMQGFGGICLEALDERVENLDVQGAGVLSLRRAPGRELSKVDEV